MKKIKTILFLLLSLVGADAISQASEMLWGPEFRVKGDIAIFGEQSGYVYGLRYHKKDVYLEKHELNAMTTEFSNKLELTLPDKSKRVTIEKVAIIDGQIVIIGSYYDKREDKNTIYGISFDDNGVQNSNWKKLNEYDATSKRNTGHFNVLISADKSKMMIASMLPFDKRDKERYTLQLYSKGLEIVWEKEFVLPYSDGQTVIKDMAINNDGITYVLAEVYLESKKERKEARKAKEDVSKQVLITYDGVKDLVSEFELQLQNKTIISTAMRFDELDDVLLTGFYKDNLAKRSGLSGVFFSRIKSGKTEPEVVNTREFSKKLISRLIGEKSANKGKEISTNYILRNAISTADGGVILIAEEFYIVEHCTTDPKTGARRCTYTYHFNSIIVVGVDNQGEIVWDNVIEKHSHDGAYGYYLSYCVHVTDKSINLVFLDTKKNFNEVGERKQEKFKYVNVRKSVAAVATIALNGEITYSVLYDTKESKVYMRPKISRQINRETLIVLGKTKKNLRLGRITFN